MLTFHDLYSAYSQDVFRFAYWLCGNHYDAEDITSETFVRAWINIASIRTETMKAYLLKIARNYFLEQKRKQRLQTDIKDTHPDPLPGPEKISEQRSELEMARKVLRELIEIDKEAFILRVQHDLPYTEIARVLQISEASARVKVHRARKRILMARIRQEIT